MTGAPKEGVAHILKVLPSLWMQSHLHSLCECCLHSVTEGNLPFTVGNVITLQGREFWSYSNPSPPPLDPQSPLVMYKKKELNSRICRSPSHGQIKVKRVGWKSSHNRACHPAEGAQVEVRQAGRQDFPSNTFSILDIGKQRNKQTKQEPAFGLIVKKYIYKLVYEMTTLMRQKRTQFVVLSG